MNRRQRGFIRELGRTASVLAEFLAESNEGKETMTPCGAIWKSMFFLSRDVRAELGGLLKGSSADDCFELAEWFEYMRNTYGKYSEVLTFCQIVCCVFRTGTARDAPDALRMLSRTVTAANANDSEPDMIPVWQLMIKRRKSFFGEPGGGDGGCGEGGVAGNEFLFGRMVLQLCCCAGEDRRYRRELKMLFGFIRALSERPEMKEMILAALRTEAAAGDPRLYCALETAL